MQTRQMLHVLALASLGLVIPATSVQAQTQTVRGASRASERINDITDVQVLTNEVGKTRIVIEGTRAFTPEISASKGSTVISVPGLWRAGRTGARAVNKNGVISVSCLQFATKPRRVVRVIASAQKELRYELRPTAAPHIWEILLTDADAPMTAQVAADQAPLTAVGAATPAAAKPIALPAPVPASPSIWSNQKESSIADAGFEPTARTLTATLVAKETAQRPGGMMLATPERVTPGLVPVVAVKPEARGSGPLAPVVIDIPNQPLDSLLGLTAAAITANKPEPLDKPAAKAAATAPKAADKKPGDKPAPVKATNKTPAPDNRKRNSDPVDVEKARVTLDLIETDVTAVLKAIADQSGVNIIVSPEVAGKKVTVSLRKVTVAEALSQIASISKFEYLLKGQTFFVGSAETIGAAAKDPALDSIGSEHVPFFYAEPKDLEGAITQAFPGLTFKVIAVSSESKLVQTDPSSVGTTGPQTNQPTSQMVKVTPRGGVVAITGSEDRRKSVRKFIEDTEKNIILASVKDAELSRARVEGYETEVYKVHNSDPDSLISLIKQLVPGVNVLLGALPSYVGNSGGGSASFASGNGGGGGGGATQAKTNMLVITGPADDVKRAIEKLNKIDVRVPLLTFEAKLVEVNNDDRDRLGISYDFGRSVTIGEQNTGDAGSIGASAGGAAGGGGGAGAGGNPGREFNAGAIFRTPYTINATINALTTQNKARILASPTLTALDNNPAIGFIGDEIKYVSNIQQTPVGQTIQTELARAGITLKVQGRVRPNGEIELLVHPEVSLVKSFLQLPNGVSLPQIATRYVDTTIRVKDGETIAIGGLLNEQDAEIIQKVPFLGDLPILGRFFRDKQKNKTRTELMVFITSRIVKD